MCEVMLVAEAFGDWLGFTITFGGGASLTRLDGSVLLMLSQKNSSSVSVCMYV